MAHRSRVCAILIDCREQDFKAAVEFWSSALGLHVKPRKDPEARYAALEATHENAIDVFLQRVPERENGVHFDIETDDVDAEVRRLEGLGARRKRQVKKWWVMEDPSGHAFCVVPVQSKAWPRGAVEWPDEPGS